MVAGPRGWLAGDSLPFGFQRLGGLPERIPYGRSPQVHSHIGGSVGRRRARSGRDDRGAAVARTGLGILHPASGRGGQGWFPQTIWALRVKDAPLGQSLVSALNS